MNAIKIKAYRDWYTIDTKNKFGIIIAYTVLVLFTMLTLVPLIWLFYSSFKLQADISLHPFRLPSPPTIANYISAWQKGNMLMAFGNSLIYSVSGTASTLFLSLSAGFALAKFGYRNTKFIYSFFTLGLLITANSIIAPLFFLETRIGLYNKYLGVILPYIAFGLPMAVLLSTSYIKGIPDSLLEAAWMDGASYLYIFYHIIMPVSRPIIGTICVLTFLRHWNEFVLVFILTSGNNMRSLPVAINSFAGRLIVDYGTQFAALVIGTIPMILFYVFARNLLIKGFSDGALKE